ncbi:MAG: hypothetical protein O6942_05140 [Bacteroidetes bacterium]|nr:hypothetical protein [Bacteroidota bacterium]
MDFIAFCEAVIATYKAAGKARTANVCGEVLRAFLRETGPYECLPFSRLSPELMRLRLIMKKTGNEKSMIRPKQAVQILERYRSKGIIFPMLRADTDWYGC